MDESASEMIAFTLRLPRSEIGFLRFLLEGYDGLAQLRAEAGRNEATLWVPVSRQREARALLLALGEELGSELLSEGEA